MDESDKHEIASKLHYVFRHCPAIKLIKVVDAAGMRDDAELVIEIYTLVCFAENIKKLIACE